MCVFAAHGYEEVMRLLTAGLTGDGRWRVPTTAAIWRARERLGVEPLRMLFDRTAGPVAAQGTTGSFSRRWRLAAVDGTALDLPDTSANAEFFGRPGSARGEKTAACPQARVVLIVECGTRAILGAALGSLATHETVLAKRLFGGLGPGTLLLADRGFRGHDLWQAANAGGADLLWRVQSTQVFPLLEALGDGSYRSAVFPDKNHRKPGLPVRVIEYTLDGTDTVYRLVTTILDPADAPAANSPHCIPSAGRSRPLSTRSNPPARTRPDSAIALSRRRSERPGHHPTPALSRNPTLVWEAIVVVESGW